MSVLRTRLPAVAVVVVLSLLGAACGLEESDLRADDTIAVVMPRQRATVQVPFTVSWRANVPGAAMYAVFVNQAPMPPDRTLEWLARDDDACRSSPGCPDEAWLQDRGVYVTDDEVVEVSVVPEVGPGTRRRSDGGVRLVVVALDERGHRIDELAATQLVYLASEG